MSVVTDKKIPVSFVGGVTSYTADVVAYNDYYPFGSMMPGRNGNSSDYRFGFNGYENDNEVKGVSGGHISFQDFGYDPRVVKRWNIDPKTRSYPWQSPYVYAANSPIVNIDVDGEGDFVYTIIVNLETGKSTFTARDVDPKKIREPHYQLHFKSKDGGTKVVNVKREIWESTYVNLAAAFRLHRKGGGPIYNEKGWGLSGSAFTGDGDIPNSKHDGANIDFEQYIGDLISAFKMWKKDRKLPKQGDPENEFKMDKKVADIIKEIPNVMPAESTAPASTEENKETTSTRTLHVNVNGSAKKITTVNNPDGSIKSTNQVDDH